jgi:hypothetical protein
LVAGVPKSMSLTVSIVRHPPSKLLLGKPAKRTDFSFKPAMHCRAFSVEAFAPVRVVFGASRALQDANNSALATSRILGAVTTAM